MPFTRAGQLARFSPSARSDDPLGLIAENLRASHYGAIPVLDRAVGEDASLEIRSRARVLGLVDERDLSRYALPVLARSEALAQHAPQLTPGTANGGAAEDYPSFPLKPAELNGHGSNGYHLPSSPEPMDVAALTARDVMRRDIGIVPTAFSLHNALLTLERYDALALPVVDAMGAYQGMISRADILAALGGQLRPPAVGGMATPLGVWLTTGSLSAGAPPLGLFLSGMVMAGCMVSSFLIVLLGLSCINTELAAMFYSGRLGATSENGTILSLVVTAVQGLLFLGILRSLPMAGIHAAEHQTVWAIERGLPLTPEYVAQMPRAHPRCGTNLVALAGLIEIIFQHLPEVNSGTVMLALLFVYLTWRNYGTFLQEWFTTKPATPKQLASGIKAGKELMERYQAQPHVMASFGPRLLNSGLASAALGMVLVLTLFNVVLDVVARLIFSGG